MSIYRKLMVRLILLVQDFSRIAIIFGLWVIEFNIKVIKLLMLIDLLMINTLNKLSLLFKFNKYILSYI